MSSPSDSLPTPAHPPSRLISLLGLGFAVVLLLALGLATWTGYRAGLTVRDDQARATQAQDLQAQYTLGLADLDAGRLAMAASRFEYILARDPEYPGAREKLAAAQAALNVTPTAPPPTLPPVVGEDPAEMLAQAEHYVADGNWDAAIAAVMRQRTVAPQHEVLRGDHVIFTALRGRGLARIQGEQMEAGIFDLDQAGQFGTLDLEARNYRAWARLYLAAKSYYGLDWVKTLDILNQLYILAPNFKDTTRLLYTAAVAYGDQLAAAGDACAAVEHYTQSQQLFVDSLVAERLAAAQTACALAPSPEPTDLGATPTP